MHHLKFLLMGSPPKLNDVLGYYEHLFVYEFIYIVIV